MTSMKTLLITKLALAGVLAVGCESTDSTEKTQPANQTGSEAAAPEMTPAETRVMKLQALDRQYSQGQMPTSEYDMRRQQILEMY